MSCNYIKIYDSPTSTTPLDENANLVIGQDIYIELDFSSTDYTFERWVDRYGNTLGNDVIQYDELTQRWHMIFLCNIPTALYSTEHTCEEGQTVDWIKLYDTPIGGNLLNPCDLNVNNVTSRYVVYIDIRDIPSNLEFVCWEDENGNTLTSPKITLLSSGRYALSPKCNDTIKAVVRERGVETCSLTVSSSDPNMGYVETEPQQIENISCGDKVIIKAKPLSNYIFHYWDDGNMHYPDPEMTVIVDSIGMSYVAHFTTAEIEIYVYPNNLEYGSVLVEPSTVQYGSQFVIKATPNEGFAFEYWKDSNGTSYFNDEEIITYGQNFDTNTFTAYFSPLWIYYVNYYKNDGQSNNPIMVQGPFQSVSDVTFLAPNFEPGIGYVFLGWSESSQSATAQYQPGDSLQITFGSSDKSLYAVYSAVSAVEIHYYIEYEEVTPQDLSTIYQNTWFDLLSTSSVYSGDKTPLGWEITYGNNNTGVFNGKFYASSTIIDAHMVFAQNNPSTYCSIGYNFGDNTIVYVSGITSSTAVVVLDPEDFGVNSNNFSGWKVMNSSSQQTLIPGQTIVVYQDVNMQIIMTYDRYTVNFFTDCSGTPMLYQSVLVNQGNSLMVPESNDLVCSEKMLDGWSENQNSPYSEYGLGTYIIPQNDMNLYTVWYRNIYWIHYLNAQNVEVSSESHNSGVTVVIMPCDYQSNQGCPCAKWMEYYNNQTIYYSAGDEVIMNRDMYLLPYFDTCKSVVFRTMNDALIQIDNVTVPTDGTPTVVIEGQTPTIITAFDTDKILGWYDVTSEYYVGTYEPMEEEYEYIFVPLETGIDTNRNDITLLEDKSFIEMINKETFEGYEIIKNNETGEIRQLVFPSEIVFETGHIIMASVVSNNYTECDGTDGEEYISYDDNSYSSIYEYIGSNKSVEYPTKNIIININEEKYYYKVE